MEIRIRTIFVLLGQVETEVSIPILDETNS